MAKGEIVEGVDRDGLYISYARQECLSAQMGKLRNLMFSISEIPFGLFVIEQIE